MLSSRRLWLPAFLLGVACATACSLITDLGELTGDGGVDGNADVASSGCASGTASDTTGVFVSTTTGADSPGCGARTNPCKTIQQGINAAKQASGKTTVYVARGAYVESLTLQAGLTVEGGWDASGQSWSPICDATASSAVTIEGVTNVTVAASYSGSATLADVTLTSKPVVGAGESLYGVFATGSSTDLSLAYVVVNVAPGGAGTDGTAGSPGADANDAGCAPGTGAAGTVGPNGSGADAGWFAASGYAPTDGTDGVTGAAGHNGTPGTTGACATCLVYAGSCPSSCTTTNAQVCGGTGKSGCGGSGGGGGTPGAGGGASVALFVWDAHVTVLGGSFTAANGGRGGSGGVGADGGAGSAGAVGVNTTCATQLTIAGCFGNLCTGTLLNGYPLDGGAPGGQAGPGGPGGHGGGGSGGVSYAIVQGGDGGVTLNNNPTLAHGAGGPGGDVGGVTGAAANRWP